VQPVLLVDDSDGRVLLEFADPVDAIRALDRFGEKYPEFARRLCLVRFDSRHGSLVGIDTTTRIRSLT
jgi:hypothetical protein